MAPFRNRDRSNRSGRGQVEHNVLEGLPITQWREAEVPIEPTPTHEKQVDKDAWPELPMPRDSHLLPLHSQQLLRAARAGRIYKPPAPQEEDREQDEEDEPKEVHHGFTVKKFVKVPRHLEEPEPEFLAKRRKGLPSQYAMATQPLRETKVKKVDADGNVTVFKALVPEGQTIEGEVQPTDAILAEAAPAAVAPGTIVEGVGVVNAQGIVVVEDIAQQTPLRRRPPPPKKKSKRHGGPGRGRKKVVFAEGATEQGTPAAGSDLLAVPRLKQESGSVEPSDGDTPMGEAADDDEGDEESDEEGEERGQTPNPARSATPSKAHDEHMEESPATPLDKAPKRPTLPPAVLTAAGGPISAKPFPTETAPDVDLQILTETPGPARREPSSSPDLPLSVLAHTRQNSFGRLPTIPSLGLESTTPPQIIISETTTPKAPTDSLPKPGNTEDKLNEIASTAPEPNPTILHPQAPPPDPVVLPPGVETENLGSDGEPDLLGSLEAHLDRHEMRS